MTDATNIDAGALPEFLDRKKQRERKKREQQEPVTETPPPGSSAPPTLASICKNQEAYETDRWAVEAILEVELTTLRVIDPCAGTGIIPVVCEERGLDVTALDITEWRAVMPLDMKYEGAIFQADWFRCSFDLSSQTVIMNPPFTLAERFVDHALALGARKVICFQRQAWRESSSRREWWENNPPARVWVCGARATCWRFDLLSCHHSCGLHSCPNRGSKTKHGEKCRHCSGGSATSHAWFIWERGHKGAEVTSAIYPKGTANV